MPQEIELITKLVETYSGQFKLVVELPPLDHIDFCRSESQPVPVLDDNVIALVETDEDLDDDDDNHDKQSHYLDDQEEKEFIEDESDDADEDTNIDNNSNTSEDD